jgi:predicted RNA-binding Zn-ribbon protein involved in translation (DUF1610 family)
MALTVTFDSTRFSRSFARAAADHTPVAGKWVRFECPSCRKTCRATLNQIARQSVQLCTGCGKGVKMVDKDGGFARGIAHE